MELKGFIKTSLIEYPGKIVSVAFVGGCNFRCPFCQNPDLVLNSQSLPSISEKEIIDHLLSKRKWLDGLVISRRPLSGKNYRKVAGIVDEKLFRKVKESVKILSSSNIDYELRTTVVPGLIDQEDVISIARGAEGVRKYVLQQFVPKVTLDKQYEKIEPYSKDKLEEMREKIADYVESCEIRGV